jgi:NADH:ubiquinone oxidoreductase subunit F (NADH-binding)
MQPRGATPGTPAAQPRGATPGMQPRGPEGAARLILRAGLLPLEDHLEAYGPLPLGRGSAAGHLIAELERAGLTGRGGAAFPAGRKFRVVAEAAGRRATVVVGNGSESEPASSKDLVLLSHSPHLVLDGIAVAADAVGATSAYLCLGHRTARLYQLLLDAIAARDRARLPGVPVEVVRLPGGYLAGQETALISALNGGAGLPTFVPPRPSDRGVRRQPTLVQNVETLAHVALIARYGAGWFREVGTAGASGSALVTLTGAVERPGVRELPLGIPLGEVLQGAGPAGQPQAVLAGGYFGAWLALPEASTVQVSDEGLRPAGAALGSGVLAVLPESACGLAETARVTAYLASQSARQCGPCTNGLPALAEAMRWIAFGQPGTDAAEWVAKLTALLAGRGACHLPDGAAGLVSSALEVFAADLRAHASSGPCERAGRPPVLPVPGPAGSQRRGARR